MTDHARQVSSTRKGPLEHVTILDLTQHLSGPFGSQILSDLGARVIKVEPPTGDPTRRIGPYFEDGDSAYYLSANRNKESVVLDLKAPGGADALLALAMRADVVIENFRPGTLAKLGIDFDALLRVNPRMVLCSITGFGPDGPYRALPAFDIVVQALAGGMSLTGEESGKSVRSGLPIGDICAGMYGAVGTLAGLLEVGRTGIGMRIDVSMLDAQVSMLSYVASYYLASGDVAGRQGRGHMSIPTYRAFTCRDGKDIVVAANTQPFWQGLARAFEREDLVADERFLDNDLRREHRDELDAALEAAVGELDAAEALARLAANGVPSAPVNTVDAALADPQVVQSDMVLQLEGRGDSIRAVGNPIKTHGGRTRHIAPPRLGEDTESVLRDVAGLTDDQLRKLSSGGAITLAAPHEGSAAAYA
ncbi:L-carnitine dehydratase/bile acid-inducible protein F [Microbacterium sp. C448]|uniref:CaiB/BaiF CoA transferase family protein n=1 Tax=Microbacterium TaxID=33882 RepID=UPI0003DE6192|nr:MULTISPECIES: CoA transferase [Microbacterium]CDJ99821.1 L-carnitine dehydratase/bile acid-inducible protein F [Microbacterium sp. C448]